MTTAERDAQAVLDLLERRAHQRVVTYVDVLHELGEVHARAHDVLVYLEAAGVLTWAMNGQIRDRRAGRSPAQEHRGAMEPDEGPAPERTVGT